MQLGQLIADKLVRTSGEAVARRGAAEPIVATARRMQADSLKLGAGPAPAARNLWSRETQTDAKGFYHMPVELCDDYEVTDLTPAVKAKIANDFKVMKDLGVKDLRVGLSWTRVQPEKNEYDWAFWDHLVDTAQKAGVDLRPYICYTPEWVGDHTPDFWHHAPTDLSAFTDFTATAVERYKGKIKSWELWNEPDNVSYWETPGKTKREGADLLAEMLTPAIAKVREIDPQAGVILGGMSDGNSEFFDQLMTKHHLGDLVDTVNVHAYLQTWSPQPQEFLTKYLTDAKALIDNNTGAVKPAMNLDEFGHSSHRFNQTEASMWGTPLMYKYQATPAYQAEALFKDHTLALASGTTSHAAWYRINDLKPTQEVIGDNNNRYLGLLDPKGNPKPAYGAFKFFKQLFDQPTRSLDGELQLAAKADSQAQVHAIRRADGSTLVIGWLRDSTPDEVADKSGRAVDTRRETVSLKLPGLQAGPINRFDAQGKPLSSRGLAIQGGTLTGIPLRGDHVFIAELPAPAKK